MVERIAPDNLLWFIQVFPNGLGTQPRLDYKVKSYILEEGMIHLINPKTHMPVSWPTNICVVDGVNE